MKVLYFIAVSLTISSSLLPTAQSGAPALIANYTLPGPEGMKGDPKSALFTSCKELYQSNPALPSGYYNIKPRQKKKRVYCEMNTINCGDTTGGWMRVAYIDANSETYNCSKWKLNYIGVWQHCQPAILCPPLFIPMCTRPHSDKHGCFSVKFSTHRVPYTKVCGRAQGYQFGYAHAFYSYNYLDQDSLENSYVSGLSVTRGKKGKRKHIWTFVILSHTVYNLTYFRHWRQTIWCPNCTTPNCINGLSTIKVKIYSIKTI